MKKIKTLITLIFFLSILICLSNISYAAPGYFYPKEYNVTLLNLEKKDVEKIEIFTPWGFFDDDNKIEIDGRLFNYNNQYYVDPGEVTEYNGIKCKILATITRGKIKSLKKGINFNIVCNDELTSFYLRIYLKDNSVVFSNYINSYTIIDEFSSQEQITEAKKIKNKTVYWAGNYETRNPWIEMYESNIELIDNKTNSYSVYFVVAVAFSILLAIILLVVILMNKHKKQKFLKVTILILILIICNVISYIVLRINYKTTFGNEEQLKIYVEEQDKKNKKEKQDYIEKKQKAKEEKEKEEKESEVIKVNLVDMSIDKRYTWKNNIAYMMTKQIRIKNSENNSSELYSIVYFSTELFENFFPRSVYDESNQIFYFNSYAYVKGNDGFYYEDDDTRFNLVQNLDLKTKIIDEKLFIPLPLYRNNFASNCFGFDEKTNTVYYYGESMGLPENYSFSEFDNNIKLIEKVSEKEYYYNSNKFSEDIHYSTLDYMKKYKDGFYTCYSAEIKGKPCIIKLYYRYNSNTHEYHYDKYEILKKDV